MGPTPPTWDLPSIPTGHGFSAVAPSLVVGHAIPLSRVGSQVPAPNMVTRLFTFGSISVVVVGSGTLVPALSEVLVLSGCAVVVVSGWVLQEHVRRTQTYSGYQPFTVSPLQLQPLWLPPDGPHPPSGVYRRHHPGTSGRHWLPPHLWTPLYSGYPRLVVQSLVP